MKKSLILIGLWLALFVTNAFTQDVKTYVPVRALEAVPVLQVELNRLWPDIPVRYYIAGLIEHESCVSLKNSRCWTAISEFKTSREQGIGLGMITRAWNKQGKLRFDALSELRDRHMEELSDLGWNNIRERLDLQARALILMSKDNYKGLYSIQAPIERLKMADAAYNGGLGGLLLERRTCGLAVGCDPQLWDKNVERYCRKSRTPLYAGRSACDINRDHVTDVFERRMPKYESFFKPPIEQKPIEIPVDKPIEKPIQ